MSFDLNTYYQAAVNYFNQLKEQNPELQSYSYEKNIKLENESMSLKRFIEGTKQVEYKGIENGFFCFHGTEEKNIEGICTDGFDPKRRGSQTYGPGEYFNCDYKVSECYTKGGKKLLLVFVIQSEKVEKCKGDFYVVRNPEDWTYSYCLPLLILTKSD